MLYLHCSKQIVTAATHQQKKLELPSCNKAATTDAMAATTAPVADEEQTRKAVKLPTTEHVHKFECHHVHKFECHHVATHVTVVDL